MLKAAQGAAQASVRLLRMYYAATVLFVILDYAFNVNVRLAFLDAWPTLRALYYLLCFTCLALMLWRPSWSLVIGTLESLLALSILIVTMGARVMMAGVNALERDTAPVTVSEIVNFLIVGGAAWLSYQYGMRALRTDFDA